MIPALAKPGDAATKIPLRVGYTYTPNGIIKDVFRPKAAGTNFELTETLKHWEAYRDQLMVLSNMDNGEDTDEWALENGYVSLVPVQFDLTAHHFIQQLNSWSFNEE